MKYKVGMYGGSFNPLHLGHVNDIIMAANQCEKLYVVLSNSNNSEEIYHKERFMWLKNITADIENVEVFEIFDRNCNKENYDWYAGAEDIKKYIGTKIDVVFSGDDYKDQNIWERIYAESDVIYFPRSEINISSTEIRANPFKYYDYLPRVVQRYYAKKVCIVGTESCGKSTLVRNLARVFNTSYVEEAGRNICFTAGGIDNMQRKDYFEILFEHKKMEKEALNRVNKILFIDTDSLVTLYYYNLEFGFSNDMDRAFNDIASNISVLNDYDLYLFLEPDVKWVQDGTRTYGDDSIREENNDKLKELLLKNNIKYEVISGNYQERYEKAKKLSLSLLK